jgi:hypothetical protein
MTVTFNPENVRTFTGNADSVLINVVVSNTVPVGVYTVRYRNRKRRTTKALEKLPDTGSQLDRDKES